MRLVAGTRLGTYEIISLIGRGGMGEVYRARDTRLKRDVAIKILPGAWAHDIDRLARFEREAELLAALNHPNVAAIYGLERVDGLTALILELVDGPTLADRLVRGPLPLPEVLLVAGQIAAALDAAHERGIVHRDLKPANVKLRNDGVVKVLDFGLAKSVDTEPTADREVAESETPTRARLTHAGVIVGTAAYMSPEQAAGEPVDKRTDVWGFGCVLYEMLTGRAAFGRGTLAETFAAMVAGPPDWDTLPIGTPLALRRVLRRCLQREKKARLRDIGDVRFDLDDASGEEPSRVMVRRPRRWVGAAGVTVGLTAIAVVASMTMWPNTIAPTVTRTLISSAPAEQFRALSADQPGGPGGGGLGHPSRTVMALSPDGRTIVFSAVSRDQQRLYRRRLDQLEATPITGTDNGANPFFSPDGRWVAFWSDGSLKKVAIDDSAAPTTLCQTSLIFGGSWGTDDAVVFATQSGGLWRVPAAGGGNAERLTQLDAHQGDVSHRLPHLLPGNQAVLFTVTHTEFPTWEDTDVIVQSFATGVRKTVVKGGADARYLSTGHLIYVRRGTLMAAPFDLGRLEVTGGALALIPDVLQSANMVTTQLDSGAAQVSVSASGSLAYIRGGVFPDAQRSLEWVSRAGSAEPLLAPLRPYFDPRLSPTGDKILLWTAQSDRNIWVYETGRNTLTRVTTDGRNARAVWAPDGQHATFSSFVDGAANLFSKPADGSGSTERLTTSPNPQSPVSWSPDGGVLAFVQTSPTTDSDIWLLPSTGARQPIPLLQSRFSESSPRFSPDGRYLAYASNESGRTEVYVQPYPGPGPRDRISVEGGTFPLWARNGRELFYAVQGERSRQRLMAVPISTGPPLAIGTPRLLFEGEYLLTGGGYDITPDGQRFIVVKQVVRPSVVTTHIVLVQNWSHELISRVPSSKR